MRYGNLHWFHWLIIGLSLLLTLFAWYISQQSVNEKRQALFQREATQVIDLIQDRMRNYEDALWAGVATIQANGGKIDFQQWRHYVNSLNLIQRYPGINGLGVIHRIPRGELGRYLAKQRIDRPSYNIHPKHTENVVLPITYIIPVKGNERAVGLDIAHEANRYTAAIKAERTGLAQITRPIVLVQDQAKTPGFLFYAPYYRGGSYSTEAERARHFEGMVYAPFIAKKLMSGVLAKQARHVAIQIKDGSDILFDEFKANEPHFDANTNYKLSKQIPIYGQMWQFEIWGSSSFSAAITDTQPLTILFGGIFIDILLLLLFITITRSNKRALNFADSLTKDLKQQTADLVSANSKLQQTQGKLELLANYDLLTSLPNRRSFMEYLDKSLARAKRNQEFFAVCFLDLNNFKQINDSLGHNIGDKLLRAIAEALQQKLRDIDYLARLSGDEFGLIIENCSSANDICKIIQRYFTVFEHAYMIDQYEARSTASIGIAMYPAGGETPTSLIKNADIAMYKAKELSGNSFSFFNETTNQKVKRRHDIESALHHALNDHEFYLVYQPQYRSSSKDIFGVEALLRWSQHTIEDLGPNEFIPIAEDCGIITAIGNWVIEQVAKDYQSLRRLNPDLEISINTSIRQLEDPQFEPMLHKAITQYQLPANKMTLEVTETAIMKHSDRIIDTMLRLHRMGYRFALDDFGTGYSSMNYLKLLPIKYIKIDQSFVGDIEQSESCTAIVKAIIQLSHAMNIKTIAEGIETPFENTFLIEHQCDYLQGYYHSKPLTLDTLLNQQNNT